MNILIVNTHSVLNSGDSAIVLAQIDLLKKHFKKVDLALVSRTPSVDRKFYEKHAVSVLPPLIPAPSIYSGARDKIFKSLKIIFSLKPKIDFVRKIKNCDLVVSSGGGYFWSNRKWIPGPMFLQNVLHVWAALIFNKQVIFFPQSFGPIHSHFGLALLKRILFHKNTIKIFPREMISYQMIEMLLNKSRDLKKIELCPDTAFLLKKKSLREKDPFILKSRDLFIALTLRQWHFPSTPKKKREKKISTYLRSIENFCVDFYLSRKASFLILPQSRGPGKFENDRIISEKLFSRLKKRIPEKHLFYYDLPDDVSPYKIINLLSRADLTVATRLHSAIFSFIAGTPAIAINYQPKSEGIMNILEMQKYCLNIEEINSEKINKLAQSILENKHEICFEIEKKLTEIKEGTKDKLIGAMESLKNP